MKEKKYNMTLFKNRFETTGKLMSRTFADIYFGLKHNVKKSKYTYREYMSSDRNTQAKIKDVGGFIGGKTDGSRRINGIKIERDLLTLDIDTDKPNVLEYIKRNFHYYGLIYSTHSHSPEKNRFRIVAPLSRTVNADEYEAVGRRIAFYVENAKYETFPDLFDETTFQANRLMFLPSVSIDGEYICELLNLDIMAEEQFIIDVDKILDDYEDYKDIYEWYKPQKADVTQIGSDVIINKNPLKAKGMVGAFNRTYTISETIDTFLSDIYTLEKNGRYTYNGGDSFGGGIVLNNDRIFYSHHGTDPANMYYRSAFDLVRIHKFGSFDGDFTPEKEIQDDFFDKTDSFRKMVELAKTIPEVVENTERNLDLRKKLEQKSEEIEKNFLSDDKEIIELTVNHDDEDEEENSKKWLVHLDGIKSKAGQLSVILANDEFVGNLFYFDTFRDNICFKRKAHWHGYDFKIGQPLTDKDLSHIRVYLDSVYGIIGERIIDDAIVVEADKDKRNGVLDWLESLEWDGEERIEGFFPKFFKTKDNPFMRVGFKHWLVGAISRIYQAGSPMDLVLIIKGKQGIGKSLFFKRLATPKFSVQQEHLYSDTKIDFNKSKDSYEQLEGIWIYEWKELAGMNMSDQESIKAFVDKTEDKFRRSYGRRNVEIKRRVAFGGTTNEKTPLRDRTGNRRFIVYESNLAQHECYINKEDIFSEEYRDQLLAEAIHLYKSGYNIFKWTEEELKWWEFANEESTEENDLYGEIENYVNMKKPNSWYSMSEFEMKNYINSYDFDSHRQTNTIYDGILLKRSDKTCIKEIWTVALGRNEPTINRFHRDLITQALEKSGFNITKRYTRFGWLGSQMTAERIDATIDPDDLPF